MDQNNDIHVFICEDPEIAQRIVKEYFSPGKVTYAGMFDEKDRGVIVRKLSAIQ